MAPEYVHINTRINHNIGTEQFRGVFIPVYLECEVLLVHALVVVKMHGMFTLCMN